MSPTRSLLLAAATVTVVACTVNVTSNPPAQDNMQRDDNGNGQATATATAKPTATATPSATATATSEPTGKVCTKMGCMSNLLVEVVPSKAGFGKGSYKVEVVADGKKGSCELKLPLPACDKGQAAKCEGDLKLDLKEVGCGKPVGEQSFGPLRFSEPPSELKVTVTKDNKRFAEGALKPDYKTLQPNGPGCDPVCKTAEAKVCADKCP